MITRVFNLLAVAMACMLVYGAADAAGCNCGTIRALHQQTRQTVRDENRSASERVGRSIESQTGTLVDALRSHARENSNHQLMQVVALRRIEDAAQINAANRLRDEFRAEAKSGPHVENIPNCPLQEQAFCPVEAPEIWGHSPLGGAFKGIWSSRELSGRETCPI